MESKRLQKELSDAKTQIAELKAKLSQAQESSIQQSALESEKRRRRAAEQRVSEMERELMVRKNYSGVGETTFRRGSTPVKTGVLGSS